MLYILIPTRAQPHPFTILSHAQVVHMLLTVTGLPIADARNALTRMVLDVAENDDTALWLDDDIYFEPPAIQLLIESLTDSNQVIMANVPLRRPHAPPAAYLDDDHTPIPPEATGLVQVHLLGFLLTAMKVGLLKRLPADPFTVASDRVTEDFSCCDRLRNLGAKLFVTMESKAGHIDGRNGHIYYSYRPPMQLVNGQLIESTKEPLPFEVRDYGLPCEERERVVEAAKAKLLDEGAKRLSARQKPSVWAKLAPTAEKMQKTKLIRSIMNSDLPKRYQ